MSSAHRSGIAVAVMSSKGGVGKTTISLGLAETIACETQSSVLLIDADPQGSVTAMMDLQVEAPTGDRITLASLLSTVLNQSAAEDAEHLIASFAGAGGSDIDGAESLDILPVGASLIELERHLTRSGREADLARGISRLLDVLRRAYDLIVVDCSPGLYLSTECWIQSCDFQLAPIKADKISLSALDLVFDFRRTQKSGPLSKWLGTVVNCYQGNEAERAILSKVNGFQDLQMFRTIVPATLAFQRLAINHGDLRSYHAKYPGASGEALRQLSKELLTRLAARSSVNKTAVAQSSERILPELAGRANSLRRWNISR